jgi:hypothetical protein
MIYLGLPYKLETWIKEVNENIRLHSDIKNFKKCFNVLTSIVDRILKLFLFNSANSEYP